MYAGASTGIAGSICSPRRSEKSLRNGRTKTTSRYQRTAPFIDSYEGGIRVNARVSNTNGNSVTPLGNSCFCALRCSDHTSSCGPRSATSGNTLLHDESLIVGVMLSSRTTICARKRTKTERHLAAPVFSTTTLPATCSPK